MYLTTTVVLLLASIVIVTSQIPTGRPRPIIRPTGLVRTSTFDIGKYCHEACQTNICNLRHPTNCYQYIVCSKTGNYVMNCAQGTVFASYFPFLNLNHGSCSMRWDDIQRLKVCTHNEDRCKDTKLTRYPVVGACAQYFECISNGKGSRTAQPRCCLYGQEFSARENKCVKSFGRRCIYQCAPMYAPRPTGPVTNSPITPRPICRPRACAPGSKFSSLICDCVRDYSFKRASGCQFENVMDFDHENAHMNAYSEQYNVGQVGNSIGQFRSNSFVKIAHYDGNDNLAKLFTISVVFKDNSNGKQKQSLISTCSSFLHNDQPTISISTLPNSEELELLVDTFAEKSAKASTVKTLKLKYEKSKWNYVEFVFNGNMIMGRVVPLVQSTQVVKDSMQGDKKSLPFNEPTLLMTPNQPMTLGKCLGSNTVGFTGFMEIVKVSLNACF